MGTYIEERPVLYQIVKGLKSQGKQVVFTNGVFDILHVGHIRSLKDARSRGDFLVLAVNSDKSVRALKGEGQPITPFEERIEILSELSCIDYITVLEDNTADDLLEFLKPNIHAKGTDYTEETVPERETVLGYGGTIAIVGDPKDHATSNLFKKIGKQFGEKEAGKRPVKSTSKTKGKSSSTKADSKKKKDKVTKKVVKEKKTKAKAKVSKKSTTKKTATKKTVTKKTGGPAKKKVVTKTPKKKKISAKVKPVIKPLVKPRTAKKNLKKTANEKAMGAE